MKSRSRGSVHVSVSFWMRRPEPVLRFLNWTSSQWRGKTDHSPGNEAPAWQEAGEGLTCPCGRESFSRDGREKRKFGLWSKENLRNLGGNSWEFSSDVLNFPREVGGEVIFESEGVGEEIDLEENEGHGKAMMVNSTTGIILWVIKRIVARH